MSVIKYLFWVLVVFNFIDVELTYLIIQSGGTEVNPILDFFIQIFGILPGMLIAKSIPLIALGILLEYYINKGYKETLITTMMFIPVMLYGILIVYSTILYISIPGAIL